MFREGRADTDAAVTRAGGETTHVDQVRLIVVDDHEVVREGLAAALSTDARMRVVGAAATAEEAIRLVGATHPDLAVIDMRLPDLPGDELCRRLLQVRPQLAVVILSTYLTEEAVRDALHAGASGYVTKAAGLAELRAAVEQATDPGDQQRRRASVSQILRRLERVVDNRNEPGAPTPQQARVLELAAEGLTYAEIARRLVISESTVRFHIQKMKIKFGARSRTELIVRAVRAGLVTTPDDEAGA